MPRESHPPSASVDTERGDRRASQLRGGTGLRIAARADLGGCFECCGYLCVASQRWAEAITVWAGYAS
jgi:hypothetical protein